MPILADAEDNEVEPGGQRRFIRAGCGVPVSEFGSGAMDLRRRERDTIEERLLRHSIIAVRVIGSDATLVTEVDVNERPRHVAARRERLMNTSRCRTSCKGEAGTSLHFGHFAQGLRAF